MEPDQEIAGKLVRPFVDADLYTCGEAFSGEQGWIEGALKSAERVLESMGLPSPPPWVDKTEYVEQRNFGCECACGPDKGQCVISSG